MRKKGRLIMPLLALGAMLLTTLPSHAGTTGLRTDLTTDDLTIDPILVKADAQVGLDVNGTKPFRTNSLSFVNLKSFELKTDGSALIAIVNVKAPGIPVTSAEAAETAPYGGGDVLIQFQVKRTQEAVTDIGCVAPHPSVACPKNEKWSPIFQDDRQYYFLHYGIATNAPATPGTAQKDYEASWGVYDPSGVLEPPLGPGVGQLWSTFGRDHSTCTDDVVKTNNNITSLPAWKQPGRGTAVTVTHNAGTGPRATQIVMRMPYTMNWITNSTCLLRSKEVLKAGDLVSNAVGFSWGLHLLGAGVGPAVGWTWYTDSVPGLKGAPGITGTAYGYQVGTPSGDPNPASIRRQNCGAFIAGEQANPVLYDGKPCMTANPTGPGFKASGWNFIA